jgi:pimeloyl-ACP methyl ester carboxylesterase
MSTMAIAHEMCSAASNGQPADQLIPIETPPAPSLTAALACWQREARRGVRNTGQYRMPFFVWGNGPPIVFIHGLADSSRAFIPVMASLRREFTCIGYDLPAGGADGARLGAYRHRHLVADLVDLLDHLGIRQSHLFGSSFGSTIVLAALHAFPDRTMRAVLQGGFAYRKLARWERLLCGFARYWPGPLATLPLRALLDHPVDRRVFHDLPEEFKFHRANTDALPKSAVARRGLMIRNIDLRRKLPAIRQPVLLICGDCDAIVTAECEEPLLKSLPNVARVELSSCGHYPQYTHAPLVAEVVRQFLAAPACRIGA